MISLKSYSPTLIEHFNHPKNVGCFDENDPTVRTGRAGCPESGDCVRVQVKCQNGIIQDICFKAQGCCATIAVASWITTTARQKPITEILNFKPEAILTTLELPSVRKHSVLLVLDALSKALQSPF